jgi:hypothetical protein
MNASVQVEPRGPVVTAAPRPSESPWLRSPAFDRVFLVGCAAWALAAGALVVRHPALFPLVLFADLWLLGYHHVISTFTRLTFDTESFRAHRALVLVVPVLVAVGTVTLWLVFGGWMLVSAYFYWQWFHYTRQSYGVFRIYARKSGETRPDDALTTALMYAVAAWGVLHRSAQAPDKFLMMDIVMLPVPTVAVWAAGAVSILLLALWLARQLTDLRRRALRPGVAAYVLSHVLIFVVGYLVVDDVNHGWLIVNIWHNLQYIALVWMFNNNRFKNEVHSQHRFLSYISQRRCWALYLAVCVAISTVLYAALSLTLGEVDAYFALATPAPLVLIAYQIINFHHYIADAVIWKTRSPRVAQHLGLATRTR